MVARDHRRQGQEKIMRAVTAVMAAVGVLGVLAASVSARADEDDYGGWRRHEWREHQWREHEWHGYASPPVAYAPPGYYAPPPPPTIYEAPGLSIGFEFR